MKSLVWYSIHRKDISVSSIWQHYYSLYVAYRFLWKAPGVQRDQRIFTWISLTKTTPMNCIHQWSLCLAGCFYRDDQLALVLFNSYYISILCFIPNHCALWGMSWYCCDQKVYQPWTTTTFLPWMTINQDQVAHSVFEKLEIDQIYCVCF